MSWALKHDVCRICETKFRNVDMNKRHIKMCFDIFLWGEARYCYAWIVILVIVIVILVIVQLCFPNSCPCMWNQCAFRFYAKKDGRWLPIFLRFLFRIVSDNCIPLQLIYKLITTKHTPRTHLNFFAFVYKTVIRWSTKSPSSTYLVFVSRWTLRL